MSQVKKICIVVTSLGRGGAERSSALLSKMLHDNDFQVHLVSIVDSLDYEFSGQLLNLGQLVKGHSLTSKIKKFRIFKKFLIKENFDYVIDNRSRPSLLREVLVARWLYQPNKTIYCVRSYNLDTYFVKPKFIAKYLYKDAFKIVGVSKEIAKKISSEYGFTNVTTIYNPIEHIEFEEAENNEDYILFFGRLVDSVKNISLLLQSYAGSQLPQKNINLILLGDGEDKEWFKQKVSKLNLDTHIRFLPFTSNPYGIIKNAKFTVLTSHYEGFPRSIIESLALGTPVISVNCKSGPNEIIENERNGLLVENYNLLALTDAMNKFVNDDKLYQECKANAVSSVAPLSLHIIAESWKSLLN